MSKDGGSPLPGGGAQDFLLHLMANMLARALESLCWLGALELGVRRLGPRG